LQKVVGGTALTNGGGGLESLRGTNGREVERDTPARNLFLQEGRGGEDGRREKPTGPVGRLASPALLWGEKSTVVGVGKGIG